MLDQFEKATGETPSFFDLNDRVKVALGSNKDRHVLIGDGKIGVEPFRWLLGADRSRRAFPLISRDAAGEFRIGR